MNDKSIRQLAVSMSLIAYAVVKFFEPQLPALVTFLIPGGAPQAQGTSVQLLSAAWSGLKIGMLIVGLEHVLYRIFVSRFLGRWGYVSSSGNYAVADITPRGFWAGGVAIAYNVSLFKTHNEVLAVFNGEGTSAPFATAEGRLTGFKDRKLTVVYQVSVGADHYDARNGILTLSLTADPNVVYGIWESTKVNAQHPAVADKSVRIGDVTFFREEQFKKKFTTRDASKVGEQP